ncbi:M23 family metallopeptidase [Streptomyces sp. AM6-12]|uniref:M23 family metallopeptidase n=1 Tax=Streptomyces sp. AM6-12 TaxID=3345149 RepID=UPI003795F4FA
MRDGGGGRQVVVEVLHRFLVAEPQERERMAPHVIAAVGQKRMDEILEATFGRVGRVTGVRDSPEGLVIQGSEGEVRAFAASRDGQRLDALLIEPVVHRPARLRVPRWVLPAVAWVVLAVLFAVRIDACWTAPSRVAWCGRLLIVAAGYLVVHGWRAPAEFPRWMRRPLQAGALVALASAWRLPRLPSTGDVTELGMGIGLCVLFGLLLARARRHRWGVAVSRPLDFPLRDGRWLVGQGGGRSLNHHAAFPEQRGALDLIQVGPDGSRNAGGRGGNERYLVYGQPVFAPCDGTVVSAAGLVEDQEPGVIRYQPPYGNHVWIDTGAEIVKLAHLRPGTVTVAAGDVVRAGQLLGEVGNSGNSSEPHLHIHAERDGLGLDLEFRGIRGSLYRGRTVHT